MTLKEWNGLSQSNKEKIIRSWAKIVHKDVSVHEDCVREYARNYKSRDDARNSPLKYCTLNKATGCVHMTINFVIGLKDIKNV